MAGKRRPRTAAQTRAAREAILVYHRTRHLRPKCGAKRRSDGEPCCRIAMANGRCYMHGGKTPRGAGWHKPVWPRGDNPNWNQKLNRKLADLERARKERRRRISQMTPDERAAYDKWVREHPPGATRGRRPRRDGALLITSGEQPPNPELLQIEEEIARLKALLADVSAEQNDGDE